MSVAWRCPATPMLEPAPPTPSFFRPHRINRTCRTLAPTAALASNSTASPPSTSSGRPASPQGEVPQEADVVVIGAGIGGLSAAAMLARYGHKVVVCESHSIAGGAAHSFVREGYHFECGPSLYSGMAAVGREANPLAHVLQAIGEELDLIKYENWNVFLPEGEFLTKVGAEQFCDVLAEVRGPEAVRQWRALQEMMRPLARAATMIPPAAFRVDAGVALTAVGRYLPSLATSGLDAARLIQPFSKVIEGAVSDPFILHWLDLLCFLLSGLPANGTLAAEVAFMFNEWYRPDCKLEFPRGGSQAMVQALVRGLEKRGGRLLLNSHVQEVVLEGGRAAGVRLRSGTTITARKAVVSNATLWDTLPLLPAAAVPDSWRQSVGELPTCPSFMHLHVGFDATGLDPPELHHIVVNSWEGGVDCQQNVVLVSIPSVVDPSLAPPGKHCLHAYLPATEPYSVWEGVARGSPKYKALKEERSQVLWRAVERVVPDIRQRAEVQLVGTPLTHARYLRRHRGTYGPAVQAGKGTLPGPQTPVPGLLCCGDSTFPGIGLPAVAASGAIVANTLSPVWDHWRLLDEIRV